MITERFRFGAFETTVHIRREIPGLDQIAAGFRPDGPEGAGFFRALIVCDEHTAGIADGISGGAALSRGTLPAGEDSQTWPSGEKILRAAADAELGRDGVFIGVGGGVVGDLCAFAASIYMRGCGLALVSTTLLGMADAALGGKTGFDLFGVKNLAGSFYPAGHVYMPLQSLAGLPAAEWKSGVAELIKTAVLAGDDFLDEFSGGAPLRADDTETIGRLVARAVRIKGGIVQADPEETGGGRLLLNLGHTFGHALEAAAGLGRITHGEAVAWGMARACELGLARGLTPPARAEKIKTILGSQGYETRAPHPLMGGTETFLKALTHDKKKRSGKLVFIIPDEKSARHVAAASDSEMDTIQKIIRGDPLF
jgi:3-dehydroquinate synthase